MCFGALRVVLVGKYVEGIFSIKIEEQTTDAFGNTKFKVGKLNLVDLAGS